ncbi:MAG: hypothetical protein KKE76_15815 [Gammaproteobacteria bacterium]|nr:hypothetical protein [Gammaproteobacteria bacterium]
MFREQEALIQLTADTQRYQFILSIPVADRPQHVRSCLESIYQQCVTYNYGGSANGQFDKVQVVIAEDSRHPENIAQHIALAQEYAAKGLRVHHFGLQEQYALLQQIPDELRQQLGSILTTQPEHRFYLKGQAANRNLSYLKCLQLTEDNPRTLYYMVDSDQAFLVNRPTECGDKAVNALNYFYYVNHIFNTTETIMLTGKLVGDPPVSPSVMAVNFLDDVLAYLHRLAGMDAQHDCQFHQPPDAPTQDAAYHDMAKLFGFKQPVKTYPYRCPLPRPHSNLACLDGFAAKLNAFFFGEHLTRKTTFQFHTNFTELTPARTIYPGNYIVNYDGLKYIIPFGDLRLRMSGPTAGRLIQAEIKQRFASANLPMLHTRHLQGDTETEFRPGVEQEDDSVNLSDEFERQFFGDLMLFSVAKITGQDDFRGEFHQDVVSKTLDEIEQQLLALYEDNHQSVLQRNARLRQLINDDQHWWHKHPQAAPALHNIQRFMQNIDRNFGKDSAAYQQILNPQHRGNRKQQIIQALQDYRQTRNAWDQLFPSV